MDEVLSAKIVSEPCNKAPGILDYLSGLHGDSVASGTVAAVVLVPTSVSGNHKLAFVTKIRSSTKRWSDFVVVSANHPLISVSHGFLEIASSSYSSTLHWGVI